MSAESKVAAPVGGVDVLAVLRAYDRQHGEPEDFGAAIAAVAELIAALPRAIEMLRVSGAHCDKYASADTSYYDDAVCDGTCIHMDCAHAADALDAALAPFQSEAEA